MEGKSRSFFGVLAAIVILLGAGMVLASCYTDYDLAPKDFDLIATFYDKSANFKPYTTYAIPDTIWHPGDTNPKRTYDNQILTALRSNIESMGYRRVLAPVKPDVDFVPVVLSSTTYVGGYYPYYPYWGYGGYYGGYYPWYGYSTVYSYSTGSLLVSMYDVARADTAQRRVPGLWQMAINGLTESGGLQTRIPQVIGQAFAQSPYLDTK